MPKPRDYIGEKKHMLTAIKFVGHTNDKYKKRVWLFQCDCGRQKELTPEAVFRKYNATTSCGCKREKEFKGLQSLQYAVYTEGDYHRDGISFEQFLKLSQENCHYCGKLVAEVGSMRIGRYNKELFFVYLGLDRKDNNLPHTLDNCVPCCWRCNDKKSDDSKNKFLEWIRAVYNNRCTGENK